MARWREFDLVAKTWTIPAERTKMNVEHVVPLTDEAVALLPEAGKPEALVFPGRTRGEPLSDATMLKALRTLRDDDATVHGLRARSGRGARGDGYARDCRAALDTAWAMTWSVRMPNYVLRQAAALMEEWSVCGERGGGSSADRGAAVVGLPHSGVGV